MDRGGAEQDSDVRFVPRTNKRVVGQSSEQPPLQVRYVGFTKERVHVLNVGKAGTKKVSSRFFKGNQRTTKSIYSLRDFCRWGVGGEGWTAGH